MKINGKLSEISTLKDSKVNPGEQYFDIIFTDKLGRDIVVHVVTTYRNCQSWLDWLQEHGTDRDTSWDITVKTVQTHNGAKPKINHEGDVVGNADYTPTTTVLIETESLFDWSN